MDKKLFKALPDFHMGHQSIEANLQDAVNDGRLVQMEDGWYGLPQKKEGVSVWLHVSKGPSLNCEFLMHFLFDIAYAKSAVPLGCSSCYKVGVAPKDLGQLMALRKLQEGLDYKSKCGVEVDREITQNVYSGFFYCQGLDGARKVFSEVRRAIDQHPDLGPDVPMRIKRGCTEYELHCGPSDQFKFPSELGPLEAYLKTKFQSAPKIKSNPLKAKLETLARWIQTAFRIGDNTYLKFTGGKRLYPATVSYSPEPPSERPSAPALP
jgi:hypothetical protein